MSKLVDNLLGKIDRFKRKVMTEIETEDDKIDLLVSQLAPEKQVKMIVKHLDGT